MKTLWTLGALVLLIHVDLRAQPMYEPFNYVPGTVLAAQSTWFPSGGSNTRVVAGNLSVPSGMPTPSGNSVAWGSGTSDRRLFNAITNGSVYYSFAFRVDNIGAVNRFDTFTMLGSSDVSSLFGAKVDVYGDTFDSYRIGIYKGPGTTIGALDSTPHHVGETVFIVARYNFNDGLTNDTCDLWVNPDLSTLGGSVAPTPNVQGIGAGRTDLNYVGAFVFQSAGGYNVTADEVRVGTTWQDVTPVPEPTTPLLVIIGSSLLMIYRGKAKRLSKL